MKPSGRGGGYWPVFCNYGGRVAILLQCVTRARGEGGGKKVSDFVLRNI